MQLAKTCQSYHGNVFNMLLKMSSSSMERFMLSEVQMMERILWTIAYVIDPVQVVGLIAVGLGKRRSMAHVDIADRESRT